MSISNLASESSPSAEPIRVAFWNLQNLFDIEISAIAADLEFTPVNGWTRAAFDAKVRNLAEVIRQMFDGHGPDLLGICEIENERVARRLLREIGRDDYQLAHVEHPDIRGIDTSLIYSDRIFTADPARMKGHLVHMRFPTRDIFEVPLKVRANDAELTVLVNHWPSRSQGRWETEPFRLTVASHCSRLVDDILKVPRREYLELVDSDVSLFHLNDVWNRNILIMGDLNDEPWDRSVLEVLGAAYSTDHLEEVIRMTGGSLPSYKSYAGRPAYLFNPMWSLMTDPDRGTRYHSECSQTMNLLDQFILSRGLYYGSQG
ncbi:MAG: hypothetical protein KDA91_22530, partial [Planctomycetaceae bacterium]|nr:hypothetical protein [Planctomycetaceae bacterium]